MLMNMMNDNDSTTYELDTGHRLHVTCMTTTRGSSSTDIFSSFQPFILEVNKLFNSNYLIN